LTQAIWQIKTNYKDKFKIMKILTDEIEKKNKNKRSKEREMEKKRKQKVKKGHASLLWTMKHEVVFYFFCYMVKLKKKNEME
jgi:hypothetical protein